MTKNQHGMTLVEVLVAAAISVIVGSFLVSIMVQNNALFYLQQARSTQGSTLNNALTTISTEVKGAFAIASGYPEDTPLYISSNQTLVLKLSSLDSSGDIIENAYDYQIIEKDPNNPSYLRQQIIPSQNPPSTRKSGNTVLVTNLDSIYFRYLDRNNLPVSPAAAKIVEITINLKDKIGIFKEDESATTVVNLRNYQ